MIINKEVLSVPTPSCHASCIARVGGETWLTWFGGTKEGDPDTDIYVARQTGDHWTAPVCVSVSSAIPHWNPVLEPSFIGADLYFKVGMNPRTWQTVRVHLDEQSIPCTGFDNLLSSCDIGGRGPVRNKCLTLTDGRILAPASIETEEPVSWGNSRLKPFIDSGCLPAQDDPLRWKPMIDVSDDGGIYFSRIIPIPLLASHGQNDRSPAVAAPGQPASARPLFPCSVKNAGAIQPALWQSADGSVHALMRSSEGCVLRSDSPDGEHWSPAACTNLPNNNSGIDLTRLPDGRIVLCLNPVSGDWAARTPLWLYISQDDGNTFAPLLALETDEGEYSYPSLACEGNTVYLSYTWKREAIAVWTITL